MEASEVVASRHSLANPRCRCSEGIVHDLLGFTQDRVQVVLILKTLRINFVDILGAGGAGGEPTAVGYYLGTPDRCAIPRGRREFGCDRLAGEVGSFNRVG